MEKKMSDEEMLEAMLKGAQEQNEKEEKLLKLLLPSVESNLTN